MRVICHIFHSRHEICRANNSKYYKISLLTKNRKKKKKKKKATKFFYNVKDVPFWRPFFKKPDFITHSINWASDKSDNPFPRKCLDERTYAWTNPCRTLLATTGGPKIVWKQVLPFYI